jgi:hypothetical protein
MARTLVDLADLVDAPRLANVIHEAAFRDLFDLGAAREAMARAPGRRLRVLERALEMHLRGSAGTRSGLEDRFLAAILDAGLPEPVVNARVAGIEVDFHWPECGLCVEVDGPAHARPRARAQDARRDAALRAAGRTVVRVTAAELEAGPELALARVRAAVDG